MQVRAGFGVDQDVIGPCLDEVGDVGIDRRDHHVHVERQLGVRPQRCQHRRAEADIRHEMPVHDVEMQPVGTGGLDRRDLLSEPGEVGGEQAGGDGDVGHGPM